MKRRTFIAALGGAAVWPLVAHAQQLHRVQRIGVLIGLAEDDPEIMNYLTALQEGLRALGWIDGKNLKVDYRSAKDLEGLRSSAGELLALGPDLTVAFTTPATNALRQATQGIPIVFVSVSDPIGPGFVESLPRPGGNITGFTNFEATMGGKWLELLREIAPSVVRASMLFNPETANAGASGGLYLSSIKTAARAMGMELAVSAVHDPAGIDEAFAAISQGPGGGLLVMPNTFLLAYRQRIVAQAARSRVPTVYPFAQFVTAGGLLSYGVDTSDLFRRAASYADRILRGTKPADLPVQQPTKFDLAVNLKTAKAIGLEIAPSLLARADEVIE